MKKRKYEIFGFILTILLSVYMSNKYEDTFIGFFGIITFLIGLIVKEMEKI